MEKKSSKDLRAARNKKGNKKKKSKTKKRSLTPSPADISPMPQQSPIDIERKRLKETDTSELISEFDSLMAKMKDLRLAINNRKDPTNISSSNSIYYILNNRTGWLDLDRTVGVIFEDDSAAGCVSQNAMMTCCTNWS